MHADTDEIRNYGRSTSQLSDDLRAAAALLARDLGPTVTAAFGPVGTRFAAALAEAISTLEHTVIEIGDDLDASGAATVATAHRFDGVEEHASAQIAWAGT